MLGKKYGLLLAALLVLALALVACQPQTVETVKEVVVTRVVTETEVVEGETVEVTRVVTETEQVEVEVTRVITETITETIVEEGEEVEVTRIVEVEVPAEGGAAPAGPLPRGQDSAAGP